VDLAFKRGGYVASLLDVHDAARVRVVEAGDQVKRGTPLANLRPGDFRVKLEEAQAALVQARVAQRQAQRDYDRARQLRTSNAVAQSVEDGAETQHQATDAQVRAASATVEEAQLALQDTVLVAPMDGTVLKRLVEVGSLVGPGSPGFVLADTRSVKVIFGVPDAVLPRVPVGTSVDVSSDVPGAGSRAARVTRVSPAADPRTRLFDVEVAIPNDDGAWKAGMIASLRIDAARRQTPPTVPLSAIVRGSGASKLSVYVLDGQVLRARPIQTGELCHESVEVTAGLSLEDRVVVDGAAGAFDGESVAVTL
jgi:multidrug efflux system membrane fusion protein